MHRDGFSKTLDFLDPISEDLPKGWIFQQREVNFAGCWIMREDRTRDLVTLKSLKWPGFIFFHLLGTPHFGYGYFGNGQANTDIAFM
jgi:radial spoke head protein 9